MSWFQGSYQERADKLYRRDAIENASRDYGRRLGIEVRSRCLHSRKGKTILLGSMPEYLTNAQKMALIEKLQDVHFIIIL